MYNHDDLNWISRLQFKLRTEGVRNWLSEKAGIGLVRVAKAVEWVAPTLSAIVAAMRAANSAVTGPLTLYDFIRVWIVQRFVGIIVVLSLLTLGAKILQAWLNPESKIRLKAALDTILLAYFSDVPEGERYQNRATLFRARSRLLIPL